MKPQISSNRGSSRIARKPKDPPGLVYLLHFHQPISPNHSTQHYLGFTTDFEQRITDHAAGNGSRLCAVAKERGIGFAIAEVWEGDRSLERKLKNRKNAPKLCPFCN